MFISQKDYTNLINIIIELTKSLENKNERIKNLESEIISMIQNPDIAHQQKKMSDFINDYINQV